MNVFSKAQLAPAAQKKSKKDEKAQIDLDHLEEFACIDAVFKSVKALRETLEVEVKEAQKSHFLKAGIETGKRPENFKGKQGIATASCELRLRGSNAPLSSDEVKLLAEHSIPTERLDSVAETFIINPKYLNDSALLERVGVAIGKVKGIPEDFIQKQEAVSKTVVSADALDVLFATKDKTLISTLLPTVSVLAIKATIGDKTREAMAMVNALLFPEKAKEAA